MGSPNASMNASMNNKAPIVLVHGAWGGAWIWRRVLAPLRAAGHEVHAVTLTGDGERVHLGPQGVTLKTHIADVLGLIRAEELRGVVLVGHSYGGLVISGAANALLGEAPSGLKCLVYVDAIVPRNGESWGGQNTAEVQAQRRALAAAHGGALPPGDPAMFGLGGEGAAWLQRRHVPHPFAAYDEVITLDDARLASVPRHFIDCTSPAFATIAPFRQRVRSEPGWVVHELATGHCPMVSEPEALLRLLLAAAQ